MKWRCEERRCGWCGEDSEVLTAINPFDEDQKLYACPTCRTVGSLVSACDEPGCHEFSSCGTPTQGGYRITCGRHRPVDATVTKA